MDAVEVQQIGLLVRPQSLNLEGTQAMNIIEAEPRGQLAKARLAESCGEWRQILRTPVSYIYTGALNLHRPF